MIKESILFVASTGLLIYFITPSNEPPEAEPVEQAEQITTKTSVKTSNDGWDDAGSGDDGWGDDEVEEAEDESFTFGDPMTNLDLEDDEKPRDEEESSARPEQSEDRGARKSPPASRRSRPSGNSPGSGELGSIDNPIILKTRNPPNPEDD